MKPSAWQRLWSHLWPIRLSRLQTKRHEDLQVWVHRGRIQLCTPKAIYSFGDLYVNFRTAFDRLDLPSLPGREVLVLGLGLGSVLDMLENRHYFGGCYTAVEWDETIIDLARAYTLDALRAPVTTIAADASLVLPSLPDQSFDLIIQDVFEDVVIPPWFSGTECLGHVQRLLRPGGLFLDNRLYRSHGDRKQTESYFTTRFQPHFPQASWIDVEGNRVLLNDRTYLKTD